MNKDNKYGIRNQVVFGLVMKNERLSKTCLERILGKKITSLKYIESEKVAEVSATVHGTRFDVYCEDDESIYNIEMQAYVVSALGKRSRYYQDMMDMILLDKGDDYNLLKKNIVIFICTYDPFGLGRYMYTFENRCAQEPDLSLEDETTKIILNTKGTQNDIPLPLRHFLHFIDTDEVSDDYTRELEQEVEIVRNDDRWRQPIMTFEQLLKDCKYDTELRTRQEVTEEVTKRVTEEVTERVTEEVTERVTEEVTERVTEEVTENVVRRMLDNNMPKDDIIKCTGITEEMFNQIEADHQTK